MNENAGNSLNSAFKDLDALMAKANDMVIISHVPFQYTPI